MTIAAPTEFPRPGGWPAAGKRAIYALPLITILPVLVFGIVVASYLADQRRDALESEILQVARHSIQATDLLLEERLATLGVLASTAAEGDLPAFEKQARLLIDGREDWMSVALRDAEGRLIASQTTAGVSLPALHEATTRPSTIEPFAVVAEDRKGKHYLYLRERIGQPGRPPLFVTARLDLGPFSQALAGVASASWTVAALDPNGVIAGRSRAPGRFVGNGATDSLGREMDSARERFFYATNQEGQRVYAAFSTSFRSGWTAAVGAPASLVEVPLRSVRLASVWGGVLAVALAGALAWLVVRTITARQAAERRAWKLESQRVADSRLTEIAGDFPGVMYRRILHPDGTVGFSYLSPGAADIFGAEAARSLPRPRSLDRLACEFVVAEDRQALIDALRRSAADLSPFGVEVRVLRPDGRVLWVRSTATARRGADGSTVWDGVMTDITPLKTSESKLRSQTEVLRTVSRINVKLASELNREVLVQSVLDAGRAVIGAAFGAFFYNVVNEADESFTLYKLSGARASDFEGFPMPRNTSIFGTTFRGEGVMRLDDVTRDPRYGKNTPYRGMPPGHLPVRSYLAAPVISRTGEVLGGLFFGHPEPGMFDAMAEETVTGIAAQAAVALENARLFEAAETELAERRKVEEHQAMLLAELNHRVKNTLAVVLAIAQQTARWSHTIDEFSEVFNGRIMALANAHTLLTAGHWRSTTLSSIVETALKPHVDLETDRASVAGPDVVAPPKQALALSLVFHELATNASKYGALSPAGGDLRVDWAPGEDGTLTLRWIERTTAGVAPSGREGFGSRLITMNVANELNGEITRRFDPSGLSAEIRLPWDPASRELRSSEGASATAAA